MYAEKQRSKGQVQVLLRDKEGKVVEEREVHNLIVSSGKSLIANLFRGEEKQSVSHMAVGIGKTRPNSSDVGLESEMPPRAAFDKNFLAEEESAFMFLKDGGKKDVLKLTSRQSGENGNFISVEIKQLKSDAFDLFVFGESDTEFVEESFKDLSMKKNSENYVETMVNGKSELVSVTRLVASVPANQRRTALGGGKDAVVTLSATFGYDDCNGPLTEAGIFNAEREGTMYNRVVFPEINKTDKLTLSLIWKISF